VFLLTSSTDSPSFQNDSYQGTASAAPKGFVIDVIPNRPKPRLRGKDDEESIFLRQLLSLLNAATNIS